MNTKEIKGLFKEWENLIKRLQLKEISYYNLKEKIFDDEQKIIEETDFKEIYGKNNNEVRKKHLKKILNDDYVELKMLELCIETDKRRIQYLKQLIEFEIRGK